MSATVAKTAHTPKFITLDPPTRSDRRFLTGDYSEWEADKIGFWRETGNMSPIVKLRFYYMNILLITDADYAQEILQKRNRNYIKEQRFMKVVETGASQTMFSSDGDEWIWRRRLMQPAFHRKQIAQFGEAIVGETDKLLSDWQVGSMLDVDEAMKVLTMMIIGRTMFNVDMAGDSADLHHAYRVVGQFIVDRVTNMLPIPIQVPLPSHREFLEASKTIREALTTIIDNRRISNEPHHDLLDMLLTMVGDEGFTQEQLIFEMSSIVFAGHETTATTLTWLFYALTQHPEIEQKLFAELDTVLNGRTATASDLANLPYLNKVINETLRYYPSAILTTRQSVEADVLDGYQIRKDEQIFINIRGLHFDERYWDKPDEFDPERFSAERSKGRHKWAFLPFLNGPRKCIGEPLSRMEMQLITATILQRFRLCLPAGEVVQEEAGFVLQPKGGLNIRLEARQ
ncbi:MAG: cytochrome P450 [Candidatus Promineifilaceae bacterium]